MAKKEKKEEVKKGKKNLGFLDPEDCLEDIFRDLIRKGAKFDLKEANDNDPYTEFHKFIENSLKEGDFTKQEFLEAAYGEHSAKSEYEDFIDEYDPDDNKAFATFIQDEHGPYSAALVCETQDEIYIALVEDCDEESNYYNMLRELTLAITGIHPECIARREPSQEVLDIVDKLHTTNKQPTDNTNDIVEILSAPMFKEL